MKNILIPTDFTIASLDHVATVARTTPAKCSIFLFHAFDMPQTLMDALNRSGLKNHNNLITEALRLKCKKLKADYTNIVDISFKTMHGTTVNAFRNYADANDIDLIFLPENYTFQPVVRDSIDPTHMFKKAGIAIMREDASREYTTDVNIPQNLDSANPQYV